MKQFDIKKDLNALKKGALITFPTDTVWGVGCLPNNENSCNKIYEIKKRDTKKPLILLGSSIEDLKPYVKTLPELAKNLMKKYWPGALTIILEKSELTPDFITSGFNTVGIRIPNHSALLEMLKKTGPIASTSINISTEPAAKSLKDIKPEIQDSIDFLLDDKGISCEGVESTVIIIKNDTYKVLRDGAINL